MDKLDQRMMNTPDLNKERLKKLKELFPDLFTTEGILNPDELKKIINPDLVKETERFEFKWFGKNEAKRLAFTPSKATLIYDEKRSLNPELADGNLIIEGENLETLKVLLSAYREKIKCIYIDPPYNVDGDFVYNDKWDEKKEDYWEHIGVTSNRVKIDTNTESNGRYHSNWLNMLFPRLLVARQLLRNDGITFISIGDKEVHHLRKMCDEVFGGENFIAEIIWQKRKGGGNDSSYVAIDHEYILCVAKDKSELEKKWRVPYDEEYLKRYKEEDSISKYYWDTMAREGLQSPIIYDIECPDGNIIEKGKWQMAEKTFLLKKDKGDIRFVQNKSGGWTVMYKVRQPKGKVFRSIVNSVTNSDAAKEINDIFGVDLFDNPKPSDLISKLILLSTDEDDLIMDFFAGSGSTGHSILKINSTMEESNRRFILVQLPQIIDNSTTTGKEALKSGYKIISDITIERIKRVIEKIEKEEQQKHPNLFNQEQKPSKTGFRVYKLAKSNFPRIEFAPDPMKTEEENLALLDKYIQEKEAMYLAMIDEKNIFDEVLLKNGFMMNYNLKQIESFTSNKVFLAKDDYKKCLICMEMSIQKETLKEMENHKDKIFICLERALDTTMKWNLKHLLGEKLVAF